jgi:hypothetical protein
MLGGRKLSQGERDHGGGQGQQHGGQGEHRRRGAEQLRLPSGGPEVAYRGERGAGGDSARQGETPTIPRPGR